jgi:redox-sensitive bicupin YhaK (pirin superfamily)
MSLPQPHQYFPAASRGFADHGWLKAAHSFSFAQYHNPERMHFGVLRVLNDDLVAGGQGFGKHPHANMEIITIPLSGSLAHRDSMGNEEVIETGEVQMMSAGSGITHSEYNASETEPVSLLQIWLFPNRQNVTPRYQSIKLAPAETNIFQQILSPYPEDAGVWAYQNAWFHMGYLEAGAMVSYSFKETANGLYIFVIEGSVTVAGQELGPRDAYGMWSVDEAHFTAHTKARVLLMEVPMGFE